MNEPFHFAMGGHWAAARPYNGSNPVNQAQPGSTVEGAIVDDRERTEDRRPRDAAPYPADRGGSGPLPRTSIPAGSAPSAAGVANASATAGANAGSPERQPYHHTRPHITQEPITDDPTRYVTRDRYTTLDAAPARRRHMGVATADPQYLPPTGQRGGRVRGPRPANGAAGAPAGAGDRRQQLHFERYLETPKPGRSIFTSQQHRSRQRTKRMLAVLIVLAIILALVWFFILR